jgi:hypothetical protein
MDADACGENNIKSKKEAMFFPKSSNEAKIQIKINTLTPTYPYQTINICNLNITSSNLMGITKHFFDNKNIILEPHTMYPCLLK